MEYSQKTFDLLKSYCAGKKGSFETHPFGDMPLCYKVMGKIFAQLNFDEHFYRVTLKCTPDRAEMYRQMFPGVIVRGYHCPPVQQPYWNTIDMNKFEDMNMLLDMTDEAYEAVIAKLSKKERLQYENEEYIIP